MTQLLFQTEEDNHDDDYVMLLKQAEDSYYLEAEQGDTYDDIPLEPLLAALKQFEMRLRAPVKYAYVISLDEMLMMITIF